MSENTKDTEASALQQDDDVDFVQHHEIDVITEGLNFGSLSSFDANVDLNTAQSKDEYIIDNVGTQAGISKALEHGAKLSSIVKAKALRLNEATTLEMLDLVLTIYSNSFASDGTNEHIVGNEQPSNAKNNASGNDDMFPSEEVDFKKLSSFFPSRVLTYSSLNWETLPMVGDSLQEEGPLRKKKRTQTVPVYHEPPQKQLATMVEYKETLETEKHTSMVKKALLEQSKDGWVNFWKFVLVSDPLNGFTKTCLNIYALTFLTVKGIITYKKDEEDEILIKASEEFNYNGDNSQGILTGLSYSRWQTLLKKYNIIQKQP